MSDVGEPPPTGAEPGPSPPPERPRRGRIPRVWSFVVPLVAVGVVTFLVGLAWKSNQTSRAEEPEPTEPIVQEDTGSFVGCTECHGNLDKVFEEGRLPQLLFRHEEHFATGVSDCSVCHPANAHEADVINKPTMSRCFTCHGTTEVAIAPGECQTCHTADVADRPPSHQMKRWKAEEHGAVALENQFECLTCHEERTCTACHGTQMPHAEEWAESPHVTAFFEGPEDGASCQKCHQRAPEVADSCDTCHHPLAAGEPWRAAHPQVVRDDGASTCFECHDPVTCATCHTSGRESFAADQERYESATPASGGA